MSKLRRDVVSHLGRLCQRLRAKPRSMEEIMFRLLGFMFILYFVAQPSFADDRSKVVGLWKLASYEVEIQATGQKAPVMGQNPTGYASFLPEGRVFFILTGEARKPAKTDQERAELL